MKTLRATSGLVAILCGVAACDGAATPPVPGPALAIQQSPASAEALEALGTIGVAVKNVDGTINTLSTATVTLTLATNPTSARLLGTTTVDAIDGIATFSGIKVDRPGSYEISATSSNFADAPVTPLQIRLTFTSISAGGSASGSHTCGIATSEFAFCWGANQHGQLGDGTTTQRTTPVPVGGGGGISYGQIVAGGSHTCALTAAGSAYCWGANNHGQLGDGTNTDRKTPTEMSNPLLFSQITAGEDHTCARAPGQVAGGAYCWGKNDHGQIGDGTTTDRNVWKGGQGFVLSISAGRAHTCGVFYTSGPFETRCWGDNSAGQLGDGTTTQRLAPTLVAGNVSVRYVYAGGQHSCMISQVEEAYCWGSNAHGQIGIGAIGGPNVTSPTKIPKFPSASSGAVGGDHSCVLGVPPLGDFSAYCFGANATGQLGDRSTMDRPSPTRAELSVSPAAVTTGFNHSCVRDNAGLVFCWGANANGQLGVGTTTRRLTPRQIAP